jgi:hypothetical protein
MQLIAPLVVDYSASRRLVVDYFVFTARPGPRHVARLVMWLVAPLVVVDYFVFAARPGASARRAARRAARRCRLLCLRRTSGCLGTSRGSSCGSSRRSSSTTPPHAGSSSTTSSSLRVRVPRHVARLIMRLVAPLVVDYSASRRLVIDYFVRRDFVLRPRGLYFIHAVHRDYLSRGNTGSTSSMPRAATTSSSGRIASTIHLD